MAVDLFSENSNISPRISFSHDFCQSDAIPIEQRPLRSPSSKQSSLNSSFDFDFSFTGEEESWSADEFFSGGKIVPTDIKGKTLATGKKKTDPLEFAKTQTGRPEFAKNTTGRPDSIAQETECSSKQGKPLAIRDETGEDEDFATEKTNTKSFWSFKRSSSLNCGSGYGRSFCPLPLMSRSKSTGSTSNISDNKKQSSKKQQEQHIKQFRSFSSSSSSSSSSCTSPLVNYGKNNSNHQKPPLKKSYGYGKGNGVRVNPVLNVAPGNLFGLGSVFSNGGRDKNRKKQW